MQGLSWKGQSQQLDNEDLWGCKAAVSTGGMIDIVKQYL